MRVLLAADIGGLLAIGFLLISFIGWIINLINAQNPPPAPNRGPQRRPRARDRKVQNEIEQFLQEAMGNKERPRAEALQDEAGLPASEPQRRPPQRRPSRQSAKKPKKRPAASAAKPRTKPGSGVSSRHVPASQDLGRGVSSHVAEHMQQRVSRESAEHLPHSVDQTVTQHLGEFTADDHDTRATVKPSYRSHANVPNPTQLIADLRSPDGIRKAILLQEILSKPRALR